LFFILEFTIDTVHVRYKHDLAGHLGNLIMRCTSLKINPTGIIPDNLTTEPAPQEVVILKQCEDIGQKVDKLFERGLFSEALVEISKIIQSLNKYWSTVEPWKFGPEEGDRLKNILYVSFEGIRIAGILLIPVMPTVANSILDTFKVPTADRYFKHAVPMTSKTQGLRKIDPAKILFPFIKR
jgi:methionyl-tRNA synthetase